MSTSNVYIYQAALYCEDCGEAIRAELAAAGKAPEDPDDETSFGSDEFPAGPYPDGGGEADSPQHCDNLGKCLNAITLPGGSKIGAWLENPLTEEGREYVRQNVAKHMLFGSAHQKDVGCLWHELYQDDIQSDSIIQLTDKILPPVIKRNILVLTHSGQKISPQTFTDLDYVYGAAFDPLAVTLWRLDNTEDGKFSGKLDVIQLPPSEKSENNVQSMIKEAIQEGAWD